MIYVIYIVKLVFFAHDANVFYCGEHQRQQLEGLAEWGKQKLCFQTKQTGLNEKRTLWYIQWCTTQSAFKTAQYLFFFPFFF